MKSNGTFGKRVRYVRTKAKVTDELAGRAKQALKAIEKGKDTAQSLMAGLKVNRNVIAGALHKLKQLKLIKGEPLEQPTGIIRRGPPGEAEGIRRLANGKIEFSRPQAVRLLRYMSKPRMVMWEALKMPLGPRNPAVAADMLRKEVRRGK